MPVPEKGINKKVKAKKEYNSTVKTLQAHADHQRCLLQRSHDLIQEQHELHLVLADGICQQKVLYKLLLPLHQQWMLQQGADSSSWLLGSAAGAAWDSEGVDWSSVVPLVSACNPLLAGMLQATPQQVQEALMLTVPELIDIHSKLFQELVVLLELISPQRCQGKTIIDTHTIQQQPGCNDGGRPEAVRQQQPGVPAGWPTEVDEAQAVAAATTQEALERLVVLVKQSYMLGGLLVLHQPCLMMEMCSTNLASRQPGVSPMGHFIRAAERLGLSSIQVQQLRMMLQQYNRGMQVQLQEGLHLLELSSDSVGLQAAALTASSGGTGLGSSQAPPPDAQNTGSSPSTLGAEAAAAAMSPANNSRDHDAGHDSSIRNKESSLRQSAKVHPQPAETVELEQDASLSEQLQKHLAERMELMQLMGFWVANTLSPVQRAKFIVYSWPFYPLCSALAEGAALLPTVDSPAQEVLDFVVTRRAGMQAELEWLVRHTRQLTHDPNQSNLEPLASNPVP